MKMSEMLMDILTEGKKEVTDQEANLAQVTGGGENATVSLGETIMICTACKRSKYWAGDYSGQYFDCPMCGAAGTLFGGAFS